MQKIFDEVATLDARCYEKFGLTEDILMEHAANGMANYIRENFALHSKVTIVIGSGNNGADGIVLARLLYSDFDINLVFAKVPKSPMAILQHKRLSALGLQEGKLCESDVLVDAIVGTGFNGDFDERITQILHDMNQLKAYKIACDIPSGYKFYADTTLTMGALKKDMFLDSHKEFVGDIKVLNLGIARDIYETPSNWNLLDADDLILPNRTQKNSHKGSYGHLALACGTKSGASILSAKSALRFGVGLVTLVGFKEESIPYSIMFSHKLPSNTTAIACGMGLGDEFSDKELQKFLNNDLAMIADADIFHMPNLLTILERKKLVITPHPKEFIALLKQTNIADISIHKLQNNRFKYVELFTKRYADVTLVLKGANVIIAQNNTYFINPHGTSLLAKGGSGDVLSGLIGALLAQGYAPLDAAKNASLAHVKLAKNYKGADFSLTPEDLIEEIGNL